MNEPKYPYINVQLLGEDGNAMLIIGKVSRALRVNRISTNHINEFIEEATSGDYDNVLQTAMKWVEVS